VKALPGRGPQRHAHDLAPHRRSCPRFCLLRSCPPPLQPGTGQWPESRAWI